MARPRREIDYEQVRGLRRIMCTEEEIAIAIGFSYRGFQERKKRDEDLNDALNEGHVLGKVSLRRAMMDKALSGNVSAQIWMSKNILGYKDKVETSENTGGGGLLVVPQRANNVDEWIKENNESGEVEKHIKVIKE